MLRSWLGALCLSALGLVAAADEWDAQAAAIVANMTTDQIIGQMTQIAVFDLLNADYSLNEDYVRTFAKLGVGSYLSTPFTNGPNNGTYGWTVPEWRELITRIQEIAMEENDGHPMLYGIDSVHGAGFVLNTTLFGHQINGAASFNPDLVYEMGRATGQDTLAAGIPWVFGPVLEIASNPHWPRTYETFGEDPFLAATMADAVVRGLQSNNQTSACMKHFIGYSKTPTGHDKDAVTMSDYELLNYFAPTFRAAVNAGAYSTMENYISLNGVPVIANSKILSTLLRSDFGFDGLVVTDFDEIGQLTDFHRTARTPEEAVHFAVKRTDIDMSMSYTLNFYNYTHTLLDASPEYLDRLTKSAERIVKLKLKLGLYDTPVPGADEVSKVRSAQDTAAALELARESIVLLQNNASTLPLSTEASVFLTGHSAHDIGNQCGGWSISWAGISGNELHPYGVSVKDGLEAIAGDSVTYFNGLYVNGTYSAEDLVTAKELAAKAEYTIAVIGEEPYAEKSGDIDDLALPAGQIEYVKEIAATGTKVIVVLFEGRPRLLGDLTEHVYAVIDGLLACELGGQAVAEIIYGQVNPSGRLPLTYPKDHANVAIPYNHRVSTQCASGDYCEMQWEFGHGLSYTTFEYSDLTISKSNITSSSDVIDVSVTVTNSGTMAGKETVMLFLSQPYRSFNVPEVKELKKFSKISLNAYESTVVSFTLTSDDWSVYYPQIGSGFKMVAEDADYVIAIKPETDCDVYNTTAAANPLCATFALQTGEYPYGSLSPLF